WELLLPEGDYIGDRVAGQPVERGVPVAHDRERGVRSHGWRNELTGSRHYGGATGRGEREQDRGYRESRQASARHGPPLAASCVVRRAAAAARADSRSLGAALVPSALARGPPASVTQHQARSCLCRSYLRLSPHAP